MLNKKIFQLAHELAEPSFNKTYNNLMRNQWRSHDELVKEQEKNMRNMLSYCYENIPYYHKVFRSLSLRPEDFRTIENLERLPIMTKETIKNNWEDFKPKNLDNMRYKQQSTGGSTGTPFQYRLSKNDRFLGGAILYRGWGYGGYELGDRMVFMAGSSLGVNAGNNIVKKAHEFTRNIRKLSSFDMGEAEMQKYASIINDYRPKFIRGYASSIYFYAKWMNENNIRMNANTQAVFTTAEKLFQHMREEISEAFGCEVLDGYGLNDGGVSAYECTEHSGLHIDTERSIMEVVGSDGETLEYGEGGIIATSLHNYAMPLIRYDTGDVASLSLEKCNCGRDTKLLNDMVGRSVDILITPEGDHVHGWFFLYIFWEHCHGIKEYQVTQKNLTDIEIKLLIEEGFDDIPLDKVRSIVYEKSPSWNVQFKFVDSIDRTGAGKYKFIINEYLEAKL